MTIRGDATRLTELINNLLDNAIRYSRNGGRVTVRVAPHPPRVSVSDDGPAIPVDERERVFERFHRLLGTHADGSGLGLAIVQEIAQAARRRRSRSTTMPTASATRSPSRFPHADARGRL